MTLPPDPLGVDRVSLLGDTPPSGPSRDDSSPEEPSPSVPERGVRPRLHLLQQNTFLVAATVEDLHYPGLTFELAYEAAHWHLRVACPDGTCNVTGEPAPWSGRWWRISQWATKQEIVGTAFKAVITALEHEVREQFLYRERAIYDGHLDVDRLWELRGRPEGLDEREAV